MEDIADLTTVHDMGIVELYAHGRFESYIQIFSILLQIMHGFSNSYAQLIEQSQRTWKYSERPDSFSITDNKNSRARNHPTYAILNL